eukprot:TRINITY_DN38383_c0_g1_i1.p1 TRINITY_DN38383_c0_g1~~TRINITY_DN38383_c0_g1_i1.p1  ORF type:complete len:557 (+),score=86.69 TRINITY_DN38383_c0_g1_i1:260-1930(+)
MGVPNMDGQVYHGLNQEYCASLKKGVAADTGLSSTRGPIKGVRRPAVTASKPKGKNTNSLRSNSVEVLPSALTNKYASPSKFEFLQDLSASDHATRGGVGSRVQFRNDENLGGQGRFSAHVHQSEDLEGKLWFDEAAMYSAMGVRGEQEFVFEPMHPHLLNFEKSQGSNFRARGPSKAFEASYEQEEYLQLQHRIAQDQMYRSGRDRRETKRSGLGIHENFGAAMEAHLQALNLSGELASGTGGPPFHHQQSFPCLHRHQIVNVESPAFASEFSSNFSMHGMHDNLAHGEFPLCFPDEMRPAMYDDAFLNAHRLSPPLTAEFGPHREAPWLGQHHADVAAKANREMTHVHRNQSHVQQQQSLQYVHEQEQRQHNQPNHQFHRQQHQQHHQAGRFDKPHLNKAQQNKQQFAQQHNAPNSGKRVQTPSPPPGRSSSSSAEKCPPSAADTSPRSVLEFAPRLPLQAISLSNGGLPPEGSYMSAQVKVQGGYDQGGLWRPASSHSLNQFSMEASFQAPTDGEVATTAARKSYLVDEREDVGGLLPSDADFQFSLAEVWLR